MSCLRLVVGSGLSCTYRGSTSALLRSARLQDHMSWTPRYILSRRQCGTPGMYHHRSIWGHGPTTHTPHKSSDSNSSSQPPWNHPLCTAKSYRDICRRPFQNIPSNLHRYLYRCTFFIVLIRTGPGLPKRCRRRGHTGLSNFLACIFIYVSFHRFRCSPFGNRHL